MAELNGLEPSSAWLTTKCLTSRPQFRTDWGLRIADCGFQKTVSVLVMLEWQNQSEIRNPQSEIDWVGRRELDPHWPQSQCGALPIELRPTYEFRIADFGMRIRAGGAVTFGR